MVEAPLGRSMEPRDMIGELIHYVPLETARFGECIEQQILVETPHDDDPIDSLTFWREPNGAASPAEEAPNLLVKRRCGTPVQSELGLTGTPPKLPGREVEIGVFYRALQLEDALAREKNQRGVGFNDLDPVDFRTIGGRVPQKRYDVPLIVAQKRLYKV